MMLFLAVGSRSVFAASPAPSDLGLSVVNVRINSVTANFGDWFGPYWVLDYAFSAPNVPSDIQRVGLSNACGGNCWTRGFTFRSNTISTLSLTLYDDQSCCLSGLQQVAFNGGNNYVTFRFSGAQLMSTGGQCAIGVSPACPVTLSLSGTSGGKNAVVSVTIDVQSALQYQASLRRAMLQQYYDMGSQLQSGQNSQQCFNNYLAGQRQLNEQLLPLIITPFTLIMVQPPTITDIIKDTLRDVAVTYISAWIVAAYAQGNTYPQYKVPMFPGGNIDCGNLQFTWQSYSGYVPNTGYNGQLLLNELTWLITPISNEMSNLAANNIGLNRADQSGVIFDLNTQKSQIQTTQQRLSAMKAYLQGVVDGVNGSTCFYTDAPQWRSCGPYAQYLISNYLTPLQTLLNKDADYTNATYNLIYNAANTLSATLNGSTCNEIGVAYSASISGTGGMLPRTYWISFASGSLPPGLSFSNGQTGQITGTPTTWGNYAFSVTTTDGAGDAKAAQFWPYTAVHVYVVTTTLPAATAQSYYSSSMSYNAGCSPYSWSLYAGSLPPGLSLSGGGVVSGTPTNSGTYSFTVKVADGVGGTATQALSLLVNPPPPPPPGGGGGGGGGHCSPTVCPI